MMLLSWRLKKYSTQTRVYSFSQIYQSEADVVAAIMTQLSLKAGLKAWGKQAQKAVHLKMKQLHFRGTFNPMRWTELIHTQRQSVLESHMFLK
jgi:hypothetical protein